MGVGAEQSIWRITRIQPPFSNHKLDHFGHVNFANVHLSPSCWDVQTVGCKVLCACGAQNLKRLILLWTHQSWYKGGQNASPCAFPEVGICLHSSHGHVVIGCMPIEPNRYISSMICIYIYRLYRPWFSLIRWSLANSNVWIQDWRLDSRQDVSSDEFGEFSVLLLGWEAARGAFSGIQFLWNTSCTQFYGHVATCCCIVHTES